MVRVNIRTRQGAWDIRYFALVFLEPHCAKEDAALVRNLQAGAGNIPGFYAEPHLRVQMRCSWFPIGHLPSYGESAHSVRLFQAVLHRAQSPPVIFLIPYNKKKKKKKTGYFF